MIWNLVLGISHRATFHLGGGTIPTPREIARSCVFFQSSTRGRKRPKGVRPKLRKGGPSGDKLSGGPKKFIPITPPGNESQGGSLFSFFFFFSWRSSAPANRSFIVLRETTAGRSSDSSPRASPLRHSGGFAPPSQN